MNAWLTCFFFLFFTTTLHAQKLNSPPSFLHKGELCVFTNFLDAHYNISFNSALKSVTARSKIRFEMIQSGKPVFDLVEKPIAAYLDGIAVSVSLVNSPDKDTWFQIIDKVVGPGEHILEIHSTITENIAFAQNGASSAFWFTDLGDRSFLEAYLPTSFEYDQYKMVLHLEFENLNNQTFYTNGTIVYSEKNDSKNVSIHFPETFTSSSLYFHTAPKNRYFQKELTFRSLSTHDVPIMLYTGDPKLNLNEVEEKVLKNLEKLESSYGPFPHKSLTIFIAGAGGMEYNGATMTDLWSLNHEITHSYFARGGLVPANGNTGWLDEAITTWSDQGSPELPDIKGIHSNMAGNSVYRRYTHMDSYNYGKKFISFLNYKFKERGGLTPFLNDYTQKNAFVPTTTESFIEKISEYYSENLKPLFLKHVYTKKAIQAPPSNEEEEHPRHMKLTIQEMRQFL